MTGLVGYLVLFTGLAIFFVLFHLLLGMLVRPIRPDPEKLTIYECGEPTIGSAWIQFDLRFYVVALLFVIFDVEVAFFFPWAIVFNKMNTLASPATTADERAAVVSQLAPPQLIVTPSKDETIAEKQAKDARAAAHTLAWIAFGDIVIFFGVLFIGYLYLWKRGDLDWVRSIAAERPARAAPAEAPTPDRRELASVGH